MQLSTKKQYRETIFYLALKPYGSHVSYCCKYGQTALSKKLFRTKNYIGSIYVTNTYQVPRRMTLMIKHCDFDN